MRIKARALFAIVGLLALAAGSIPAMAARKTTIGTATLIGSDGSVKGQLRLIATGDRLELKLDAKGLPPGQHGVHLHSAGSCNAPDFASAGPHLNPQSRMHGSLNPQGSHLGDLPNLVIRGGGGGSLSVTLAGAAAQLTPLLFDADGTALVVHAAADDYRTDPSGNSGARIACGVLTRIR